MLPSAGYMRVVALLGLRAVAAASFRHLWGA